jgi:DNA-binding CsgD family transcriptional regulator
VNTSTIGSRERCAAVTAAVEAAEDGLCVTDRQGGLLYQNAALRRLLTAESEQGVVAEAMADARHAALARADERRLRAEAVWGSVSGPRIASPATTTSAHADTPSITLQVRTSASEYRVRGTTVRDSGPRRDETLVILWVRRCRPRQLTLAGLRERYGLTPRETRVAALVAARSGSREIAEALGISPHTARRHAEAVLRKLGVHSRSDVRERLRE